MTDYAGDERRQFKHCDLHKDNAKALDTNTKELVGIKTGIYVGRWIAGILIVLGMAVGGNMMRGIETKLTEISMDVKMLAPVTTRLNQLEKVQDRHDDQIRKLQQGAK